MRLRIREFAEGDESELRQVFHSSIHQVASRNYSAEQIEAWAPAQFDAQEWAARMRGIRPFVAELAGQVAGYADLQPDGYIDHFYVAGHAGGQGVGRALMGHIHEAASVQGIARLWSHVSLTAQPFFERAGFVIVERRLVTVRGAALANARMQKFIA